ncbi:MFS transporter, partial [Nocardioides pakistanensis]
MHDRAYRRHQLWTLALATVAFAASAPGQSFLISVFVDDLLLDTGLSRTTFSALYAGGTVVSAMAMVGVGRLIDRRGLRAAWFVVSLGLVAAAVLASVAVGAVTVFVAVALLRTSGQGSLPLLGTLLVAASFERRRARAMALAHLGVTGASILLPPLVAWLIVTTDWRTAYRVLALAIAVLVVPLGALVRIGPPRQPAATADTSTTVVATPAMRSTRRGRSVPTPTTVRLLLVMAAPPLIGTAVTLHAISILGPASLLECSWRSAADQFLERVR